MTTLELKEKFSEKKENFWMALNPMTKLVAFICVIAFLPFSPSPVYGYLVLIAALIILRSAKKLKEFWKVIRLILIVFVLVSIIFRSLLHGSGPVFLQVGPLKFYTQGLVAALSMSSVVLTVASGLLFFYLTTDPEDLMLTLESRGVSANVSYVVLSTMQLIPQFSAQAKVIQDSQRARGIEIDGNLLVRTKAFIPIVVPMILSALSGAEERTLALESRGYSLMQQKSRIKIVSDTPEEKRTRRLIIAITVVACICGGIFKWLV